MEDERQSGKPVIVEPITARLARVVDLVAAQSGVFYSLCSS